MAVGLGDQGLASCKFGAGALPLKTAKTCAPAVGHRVGIYVGIDALQEWHLLLAGLTDNNLNSANWKRVAQHDQYLSNELPPETRRHNTAEC